MIRMIYHAGCGIWLMILWKFSFLRKYFIAKALLRIVEGDDSIIRWIESYYGTLDYHNDMIFAMIQTKDILEKYE